MSVNTIPTCPTGCSDLPVMDFNFCAPENSFGEISHIFLAALDAECFTDWTSITEWTNRLDNDSLDPDAIRFMHVMADKPVGAGDSLTGPLGRTIKTPMTHTVNIEVWDVSSLNYDFMRASQCNTTFRMWYVAGDYLFGGNCGIEVVLNLDYLIERGQKSIHKISGTATWEDPFTPERCTNPLAGVTLTD